MVLDSPAGLHGKALERLLGQVNRVIVPVQPCCSTSLRRAIFLRRCSRKNGAEGACLRRRGRHARRCPDPGGRRTRAVPFLVRFPSVLSYIRDSQLYVQLAANGMTLFDLTASRAARDIEQWEPILDWAEK